MTVALVEAPEAVSAAAGAGSAAARARAARPLPPGGGRPGTGGPRGRRRFSPGPPPDRRPPGDGAGRAGGRRASGPDLARAVPRAKIHRSNYQAIVLAEYVAAVILAATAPIVTKRSDTGLSPYRGQDMVRLVALTFVYFLLALLSASSGPAARASAWFGALILLTVGLGQAAHIAKELDLFGLAAEKVSPALKGGQ